MDTNQRSKRIWSLLRNFAIELVVYAVLVIAYSVVVFHLLGAPLTRLFDTQLTAYAVASLVLIIAQGVLLDGITSFLLDQLHLERLE